MKYNRLLLILILVFAGIQLFAQAYYLHGKVSDAITKKKIVGAHIQVQGTPYGGASDRKGGFVVKVEQLPATVVVTHIGFETEFIKLKQRQDDITVELLPKTYLLDSVNISAERIVNITKDKPLYIWDYEIFEDKLLVLAYEQNSIFRPRLILMNFEGDTICTRKAKGMRSLYKDCVDNVHVIGREEFHQVYFDGERLQLLYPNPIINIRRVLDPCYEFHDGKYIVFKYFHKRQVLQYYTIHPDNPKPREFATYWDSLGLVLMMDTMRFMMMNVSPVRGAEKRFRDEMVFDPIVAPLIIAHDSIYVFDYDNGKLEQLHNDGTVNNRVKIDYHKRKNWKKDMLVDDALGKVYTLFLRDGIFTLYQIDLDNGKLGEPIPIPDYPFIQKMQVHNGYLYFIYKEKNYDEYKKLFKMLL